MGASSREFECAGKKYFATSAFGRIADIIWGGALRLLMTHSGTSDLFGLFAVGRVLRSEDVPRAGGLSIDLLFL